MMKLIEWEVLTNFIASMFIIVSFAASAGDAKFMLVLMAMFAMNVRTWVDIADRWEGVEYEKRD